MADGMAGHTTDGTDDARYEAIELLIKAREDGELWFDRIFEFVAGECDGSFTGDDEQDVPCSCGMEHMGGSGGTLEQCWKYLGIGDDIVEVKKGDLLRVLDYLSPLEVYWGVEGLKEAVDRLRKECTWWDDWLAEYEAEKEEEES